MQKKLERGETRSKHFLDYQSLHPLKGEGRFYIEEPQTLDFEVH